MTRPDTTPDTTPGAVQDAVLAADEARYQALYALDTAALESLLHADYLHTHANGKTEDKAAFLASIAAARYRFVQAVRSGQRVRTVGPVVFLTGTVHTTIEVGGERKTMHNTYLTAWTRHADAWQLLHWQATRIVEG